MSARRCVVVDPFSSGAGLAPALRRRDVECLAVLSWPRPQPAYVTSFRPSDFERVLESGPDPTPVLDVVRSFDPVAVLAGAESGVWLADRLAAELTPTFANAPQTSIARRHKGIMVGALRAAGIPTIPTRIARTPAEARAWAARDEIVGNDLVVKPATSGGTQDVTLVPSGADVGRVVERLLGKVNVLGLRNDDVIVQQRVTGTEYVVDTFTQDGRHAVTNVCRYRKVRNASAFAVYESIEFLPPDGPGVALVVEYARRALDALGVRFGPAHSEVMLTDDGPVLIETGARLPGGGLPALSELATGDSTLRRLVGAVAGDPPGADDYQLDWHVTSVFFLAPRSGTLVDVSPYERVRDLPSCRSVTVHATVGERVRATTDLLSTMSLGWAVLAHADAEQVRRDHATLRELERAVVIAP